MWARGRWEGDGDHGEELGRTCERGCSVLCLRASNCISGWTSVQHVVKLDLSWLAPRCCLAWHDSSVHLSIYVLLSSPDAAAARRLRPGTPQLSLVPISLPRLHRLSRPPCAPCPPFAPRVESLGPLFVRAAHVLNQGRLTIGTSAAPYPGRVTFNLTGDYQLPLTSPPASPSSPHMLGLRAFATAGGQLELNGMYGNAPGWTTLAVTAPAGARQIVVRGDVTAWPVGGEIALASTDFDRTQAERRRIAGVKKGRAGCMAL